MRRRLKVFFDRGCRPNPGRIKAAVVIRGSAHLFDDLGLGTSNEAEWLALIRAIELAQSMGLKDIDLIGDALDVKQANIVLQNGSATLGHPTTSLALAAKALPARIRWKKREQNLAGIALNARRPRQDRCPSS